MAEYSQLIITENGRTLLAKVASGTASRAVFTRISISDKAYSLTELSGLTELSEIRQSSDVSEVLAADGQVTVQAAFSNDTLKSGYFMRTVGLFAKASGDEEEILFATAVEQSGSCYMPPFNGKTVCGSVISLTVAASDTEKISVEAGSAAYATINDIRRLESEIESVSAKPTAFSVQSAEWSELAVAFVGCKYSAEIMDENVTAADFPDIYFDENSLEAASEAAITAASANGAVTLYAKTLPSDNISGHYFIRKGALQ